MNQKPTSDFNHPSITPLRGGRFYYAMGLLLALYVVNFLDRQIVNILAEPIKQELQLADWQLGLLTGLAFALFYTMMGIPIARLSERYSRPMIIGISAIAWSAFSALCGITQNFVQLVLARMGVGVGEAGCTPAAHSLIMDYAPPEKRSSSFALYGVGAPIGGLIGMSFGGLVADYYGWRMAFLIASLPGLLLAMLAMTTLREPRRTIAGRSIRAAAMGSTLRETFALMLTRKSLLFLLGAILLNAFSSYGCAPFIASFYLRNHADELAAVAAGTGLQTMGLLGIVLGGVLGICGMLGMLFGGQLTDRLARLKPQWYLLGPAIVTLLAIPIWIGAMVVPGLGLSLVLLGFNGFFGSFWYGPAYTAGLSVVSPNMRATCSAVILLAVNIAGLAMGPLAVGIVSDLFAVTQGSAAGVRWALVTFGLLGLASAALFWAGARWIGEDMANGEGLSTHFLTTSVNGDCADLQTQ